MLRSIKLLILKPFTKEDVTAYKKENAPFIQIVRLRLDKKDHGVIE